MKRALLSLTFLGLALSSTLASSKRKSEQLNTSLNPTVAAIQFLMPPPPGTNYYTIMAGDMSAQIWSNTSHVGASCACAPDGACDIVIPANSIIYIAHVVTTSCNIEIGNNATIIIENGGALNVNGNGSISGTGNFQVDAGGSVNVTGNFDVSGTGDLTVNGSMNIGGNFTMGAGGGSLICGTGTISVGGTITGATDPCFTGGLPIQLLYFNADFNADKVELSWATASEVNNDYFTIERSKDGELWAEIIEVDGAGNSNATLEYFDFDVRPLSGVSYYRLRQTDYDGKTSLSQVVVVRNHDNGGADFTTYPNPNDGNSFNLEFGGFGDEDVLVVVRDVAGRTFYSRIHAVSKDHTILAIDLDNRLAAGTYLVTASTDDLLVSKKLIVR